MYRRYEDPHKLERMIEEAKQDVINNPDDPEAAQWLNELEERLNFAWQDDEAEVEGYEY